MPGGWLKYSCYCLNILIAEAGPVNDMWSQMQKIATQIGADVIARPPTKRLCFRGYNVRYQMQTKRKLKISAAT